MKSLRLFLFAVCLISLGTIPARAEKFSSSLHQDIGSSVSDQPVPVVPQLPPQVSGTKMPPAKSTSIPDVPSPVSGAPNLPADETNAPLPVATDTMIPPIAVQNPGFSTQPTPSLINPFETKTPKISRPDFEAKFRKIQEQLAEEKTKKKKKLSEAILDELKNYGLFFLFGLVAILLVYALRKETPSSKPHAAEIPIEPTEKPRDIWKEDF